MNMRKCVRKSITSVLVVLLVIGLFANTAYADVTDDLKDSANTQVQVLVNNEECLELKNLGDAKVRITAEGSDLNVVIPVERVV